MIVRLVQWNIWQSINLGEIPDFIKELDAHILCLQEMRGMGGPVSQNDVQKRLEDSLGMASYCEIAQTWRSPEGETWQGNGIFSKYPIIEKSCRFLQQSQPRPSDASDEGRIYVEATINVNGQPLTVGTTHLSYTKRFLTTQKKKAEVSHLLNILTEKNGNYILAGDFNSRPHSWTVKQISKTLKHCGPGLHENTWTVIPFNYHGFTETQLKWRLDYVFASKTMLVSSARIIQTSLSDHLPVMVEFSL
ncbi:MAG: endonuclease/exonuclease/phosphatase family protein [Anaerolineaceae bacterium]|nr:endonuclease/exonuclease/phosphatase family protein [Anaerolineaceae bacterium]